MNQAINPKSPRVIAPRRYPYVVVVSLVVVLVLFVFVVLLVGVVEPATQLTHLLVAVFQLYVYALFV